MAVLSLILLFALAPVHAQDVYPTSHDFGDVNVGESVITIVTLVNNSFDQLEINSIHMIGDGDFQATSSISPPFILEINESVDFEVTFTPSSVGEFSATLVITNDAQSIVLIMGTGVGELPLPDVTITDIIQFFDANVDSGTLFGVGPTNSAQISKLKVFRKILWDANHLLEEGNIKRACDKLNRAYNICDGLRIPNDFVQGNAVSALSAMISQYISLLGC